MHTRRSCMWIVSALVCGSVCLGAAAEDTKAIGVDVVGRKVRKGRSWAMLIGVDKYLKVPRLRCCGADAKLLGQVLVQRSGFDKDRVLVLTDDARDPTYLPLRVNLLSKIPSWLGLAGPDDRVIVFFSGHGFLDDRGRMYLAPLDCDRENLALTGLPVSHLRDYLSNCKARVKVLILDTCHSGATKGSKAIGVGAAKLGNEFQKAEGLVTLASCKGDEVSYEWDEKGHGAFTYWLAQGLGGQADRTGQGNGDGVVTLDELYAYAYDKVTTWSARNKGKLQTPRRISAEGVSGILALAQVSGGSRPAGANRPTGSGDEVRLTGGPTSGPPAEAELVKKHPALQAWFDVVRAAKKDDYRALASCICDNWKRTSLVKVSSAEQMKDLREGVMEAYLIRGGIPLTFGKVQQNDPEHFIIEGGWQFESVDAFKRFFATKGPERMRRQFTRLEGDKATQTFDRFRKEFPFRFRRLKGKWYYLPMGW